MSFPQQLAALCKWAVEVARCLSGAYRRAPDAHKIAVLALLTWRQADWIRLSSFFHQSIGTRTAQHVTLTMAVALVAARATASGSFQRPACRTPGSSSCAGVRRVGETRSPETSSAVNGHLSLISSRRRSPSCRAAASGQAADNDAAQMDEEEAADAEERPLLENVCFVLCRPQGPQNIGGIARVMNNFGVHDLRIVSPMPTALAPPHHRDDNDATDDAAPVGPGRYCPPRHRMTFDSRAEGPRTTWQAISARP